MIQKRRVLKQRKSWGREEPEQRVSWVLYKYPLAGVCSKEGGWKPLMRAGHPWDFM